MKSPTSAIHFETRRENKARWVKQAQSEGKKLNAWITENLNAAIEPEAMSLGRTMRPRQKIGGRASDWLRIAGMIATRSVNSTDICAELGTSRNSFVRHLADMERIYGVVIEYVRSPGHVSGWYEIRDWGVLNEKEIIRRYGN
ncbi:hypothetical protein GCM10011533_29900 [Streptosporangium jomthongense]|uniref:Transcriptional regulator n=1 Tax=Marinobacter aromaticivorans TaxID=1494078 RepID=A0ABW2IYF5_9GAMM|nr:hypothetical protein [Marinobacter aromaticivorans]GGE75540.1 hypothetical protein GCM10011533_29900 [Streptosporangium jomthongense]